MKVNKKQTFVFRRCDLLMPFSINYLKNRYRYAVALEVLLSRGGGAEICVTIPTSGGLRPPDLFPSYRNIRHAYHALYFTIKVTRRQLDELKLSSN